MIGRYLKQKQTGELDADVHHPLFDISWGEASAGIVVCYALSLLSQRYQPCQPTALFSCGERLLAATVIRCNDTDSVGIGAGEYPKAFGPKYSR